MKQKIRMWGGQNSLLAFLFLFLLTLLPCKGWADETYEGASGLVLTYTEASDGITITKMTTPPTDGNVVIPSEINSKSVVAIGEQAFRSATITGVSIPSSVKTIGYGAFYYSQLTSTLTIPSSVTEIGEYAFCGTKLSEVVFSDDSELESLGKDAFSWNNTLEEVTIPAKVTKYGDEVFGYNLKLKKIYIKNPVPATEVGTDFLETVYQIKIRYGIKIIVPKESVESYKNVWKAYADYICPYFESGEIVIENGLKYKMNSGNDGWILLGFSDTSMSELNVPSSIQSFPVVEIAESAFSDNSTLTSVSIPSSVKSIGAYAFQNCTKLTTVAIEGNGLQELGNRAFSMSGLTSIALPSSLVKTGEYTLDCSSLRNVKFNATSIDDYDATGTFAYAKNIEHIFVPVSALQKYKDKYTTKADKIFASEFEAEGLKYEVNDDLNTVNCKGLASDNINATSVSIPTMVHYEDIEFNITSIAKSAFAYKNKLQAVTFAENSKIEKIGEDAFGFSAITSVVIPASVKQIESSAFSASGLLEVTALSETPCSINSNGIFYMYLPQNFRIYVPSGSVETYCEATGWSKYKDYIKDAAFKPGSEITDDVFKYTVNEDGASVTLTGFKNQDTAPAEITIPATVDVDGTAMPVMEIGKSAFNGNRSLTSVDFSGASNLTTISKYAFANTTGLQSITIPESVTSIGEMAFMGSTVSEVNFPEEGNLELGSLSFAYTLVSELTIPKSVKRLNEAAFGACSLLKTVNMESDEPCTLGDKVFCNAEDGSFDEGFNIYVPKDKVEAYQSAWTSYQEYIGVKPATTITSGNLKYELNADGETVTVLGLADDAEDKYTVNIPATVKVTVNGVEKDCKVTAIAADAFKDSGASVTVGENVTSVGANALDGAMKITFLGTTAPELGDNALGSNWGADQGIYITVPAHSASTYSQASTWSNYQDAIMAEPFDYNGGKFTILADGNAAFVGYKGDETEYSIPERVNYNNDSYEVVRIMGGKVDFAAIEKLTIPNTVKTIDQSSLSNVSDKLEEITYLREDASDVTIGNQNLQMATALKAIYVKNQEMLQLFKEKLDDQSKDKVKLAAQPVAPITIVDDGENGVTTEMEGKTYEAGKITYKRSFSQAGQYGTIALPFNVASSEWNEYFDAVYTLFGAESMGNGLSKLKFHEVDKDASLYAKNAYFVKLKDGVQDISLTNAEETQIVANPMVNCIPVSYDGNDGTVTITPHASWQKVDGNDTQYYTFNADGTFGKSDYVVPFRMCLTIETSGGGNFIGAPAFFSIELPGGATTGISGVSAEKASKNAGIYSIDGKLVRANGDTKGLAKGVYIIGGKKIVVK